MFGHVPKSFFRKVYIKHYYRGGLFGFSVLVSLFGLSVPLCERQGTPVRLGARLTQAHSLWLNGGRACADAEAGGGAAVLGRRRLQGHHALQGSTPSSARTATATSGVHCNCNVRGTRACPAATARTDTAMRTRTTHSTALSAPAGHRTLAAATASAKTATAAATTRSSATRAKCSARHGSTAGPYRAASHAPRRSVPSQRRAVVPCGRSEPSSVAGPCACALRR
jgi:hypothetical protein